MKEWWDVNISRSISIAIGRGTIYSTSINCWLSGIWKTSLVCCRISIVSVYSPVRITIHNGLNWGYVFARFTLCGLIVTIGTIPMYSTLTSTICRKRADCPAYLSVWCHSRKLSTCISRINGDNLGCGWFKVVQRSGNQAHPLLGEFSSSRMTRINWDEVFPNRPWLL